MPRGKIHTLALLLVLATSLCQVMAKKMLIGYFPNWLYANYPVEKISYNTYTHINYAFAILNTDDLLPSFSDDWAVEFYLPKIVTLAHNAGTKVLLSIGGWTGSQRFSPMVASPASRKNFIDWNMKFIKQYGIDGVDLDWEYPGNQGAGCNDVAPDDATNFLLLLEELRKALDAEFPEHHKEISLAVHVEPFLDGDEKPMEDVSAYVPFVDHFNLMTYDINGAWATVTGPNAPFQSLSDKGARYSFVESIKAWKAAGVPAEKIAAGLAYYGRSIQAQGDMSADPKSQYQPARIGAPKGDMDDAYWQDPYCPTDVDGMSGIWKWSNLRSEGLLTKDWKTAGHGWIRYWDDVSKTPWLFHPQSKVFISYDDPQSINIKVDHALCEDIGGVMVWDLHQDNGELLKVVSRVQQKKPAQCPLDASYTPSLVQDLLGLGDTIENVSAAPDQSASAASASASNAFYIGAPFSSAAAVAAADTLPGPANVSVGQASVQVSAASAATTQPTSGLMSGAGCSTDGQIRCVDSARSHEWVTCNMGRWVMRNCQVGQVCHELSTGNIFCDQPPSSLQDFS